MAAAAPGIAAKDIVLAIIAHIGADGATGHAIEFAGSAIRALSIEGRLTLCNMSIEAGARCGMVAPDETTFAYLKGRPYAPQGRGLRPGGRGMVGAARPTRRRSSTGRSALDADDIAPIVTWGTSPEDALPIDASVPDPAREPDEARARYLRDALDYMGIAPGKKLTDIAVDRVFIGSCTNSRIEDLRAAAAVLAGRTSKVPGLVSAGSTLVKRQAEEEGLDRIFRDAGLEWGESGCSMCVGINGDLVAPGERCASTTNRNFRGRQGPGARTHLMSPAMVAAAAVTGHLADVRPLPAGREGLRRMDKFTRLTGHGLSDRRGQSQHRSDSAGALSEMAALRWDRQGAVPGSALRCRRKGAAGFSDQQAGVARRQDRGRRRAISAAAPRARPRSMRSTTTASAA